jgi:hypothetical protein
MVVLQYSKRRSRRFGFSLFRRLLLTESTSFAGDYVPINPRQK